MEELDPNLRLKVDGANDEDELDTGTLPTPDTCNCEVWQRCVPNSYGQWTCNCINPQQCDDTTSHQQYCGSDGYTYTSICRLKATACLLDLDIQVASQGPCPERDPVLDESSSESSQSSISDPESTTLIFATLTEGQGNDSVPPRNETRQASSGNYLACGYNTDRYNTNTTRQIWGRISGGDYAEEGKWPWQVALFCRNCKRCLPTFFCGGSLIASNWVLSAAHCFKDCPASNIRVYTGFIDKSTSSLQLFDPALVYTLDGDDALIKHEAFNSSVNLDNDIALLRLSCSVKLNSKITPICMPQFVAKGKGCFKAK
ncbi:transmembrane protease serine 2-like isoform X2 [Acanthaster planci]|uniref:Transmembrane protease serine 2-like isoform X2 n=1 Tax=Acanthaster planci TaxID=133434 RepID=A0A8B7ZW15_ACAPL|nr:transmembrane protease serine 2-like isoform X2 [Acanthaster planci]